MRKAETFRDVDRRLLINLFLTLSQHIKVQGSYDHILDRMYERGITVKEIYTSFASIVCQGSLCMDLFESAVEGGQKNFRKTVFGVKVYYSVYIAEETYKVVFRTVCR